MKPKDFPYRRKQSTVRFLSDCEAAWIGAMVEAEGCVTISPTNVRVVVANTDVEIISTCLRLVGDGSVCLQQMGVNRPVWTWYLGKLYGLTALAPQIAPYMTIKGERLINGLLTYMKIPNLVGAGYTGVADGGDALMEVIENAEAEA